MAPYHYQRQRERVLQTHENSRKTGLQRLFRTSLCILGGGADGYTNKLLGQYFPKEEPLDNVQQDQIIEAVKKPNERPRKKLGFKTPKEVFYGYTDQKSKLALAS